MTWLTNPYRFGQPGPPPLTATTHYRVVMLGGWQSNLYLSEVEMATSPGGANICTGGTPFGTALNVSNLFDGNTATESQSTIDLDRTIGYEFPTPVVIAEVRIRSGATLAPGTVPLALQASYDGGTTWLTYALHFVSGWTVAQTRSFAMGSVALPTADREFARVWRVQVTIRTNGSTSGQAGLSEMEMAATPGGANLCVNGTASASYQRNNESITWGAASLANGTVSGPGAYSFGATSAPWIFGCMFAVPTDLQEVRLFGPGTTSAGPGTFMIEWSSDGLTWNVTDTYSGVTWPSSGFQRDFAVSP